MARSEEQMVAAAHKRQIAEILRNDRRRENILRAIRAGLQRYANSTRGEKSLGVKCNVRIEHNAVVMGCHDGTKFTIGFK